MKLSFYWGRIETPTVRFNAGVDHVRRIYNPTIPEKNYRHVISIKCKVILFPEEFLVCN